MAGATLHLEITAEHQPKQEDHRQLKMKSCTAIYLAGGNMYHYLKTLRIIVLIVIAIAVPLLAMMHSAINEWLILVVS